MRLSDGSEIQARSLIVEPGALLMILVEKHHSIFVFLVAVKRSVLILFDYGPLISPVHPVEIQTAFDAQIVDCDGRLVSD